MRLHKQKRLRGRRKLEWKPDFQNAGNLCSNIQQVMQSFMLVLKVDGTVVYVSEIISQLLGYDQESVIGKPVQQLMHPADIQAFTGHFLSTQEFAADFHLDTKHSKRMSVYVRLHDTRLELTDKEYELVHIVGKQFKSVSRDDQNPSCEWHTRLICVCRVVQTGFLWEEIEANNTTQECVTYHNLDGTLLFADSRWCRIVGYMPDELSGCSHYDFVHPEDLQIAALAHHRVLTQDTEVHAAYRLQTRHCGEEMVCARSCLAFHPYSGQPCFILTLTTVLGENEGCAMMNESQKDVCKVKKDPAQSWLLDDFHKVLFHLKSLHASQVHAQHAAEAESLTLATTGEGDLIAFHPNLPFLLTENDSLLSGISNCKGESQSGGLPTVCRHHQSCEIPLKLEYSRPAPNVMRTAGFAEHSDNLPDSLQQKPSSWGERHVGHPYTSLVQARTVRGRGRGRGRGRARIMSVDGGLPPSRPRGRPRGSRSRVAFSRTMSAEYGQGRGVLEEKSRQQVQRRIFGDKLGSSLAGSNGACTFYDEPFGTKQNVEMQAFSHEELVTAKNWDHGRRTNRICDVNCCHTESVRQMQQNTVTKSVCNERFHFPLNQDGCEVFPQEHGLGCEDRVVSITGTNQSILKDILRGRIQSPLSAGTYSSSSGFACSPGHEIPACLRGRPDSAVLEKTQKFQVLEQVDNKDELMGRWSGRELEELHIFSAQLYGKHLHMEHNLAAQDSMLQVVEEQLRQHAPNNCESVLYHRLHHRLQNIQASRTEQEEELHILRTKFQHQLQATPSRCMAIVPPIPRSAATSGLAACQELTVGSATMDCSFHSISDTSGEIGADNGSDPKQHKIKDLPYTCQTDAFGKVIE